MNCIIFILGFALSIVSAKDIQISGTIKDVVSREAIKGATVTLSGSDLSDISDAQGAFDLVGTVSIFKPGVIAGLAAFGRGGLKFNLDKNEHVSVTTRTIHGRTLYQVEKRLDAGSYEMTLPAMDAGILVCELRIGNRVYSLKKPNLAATVTGQPGFRKTMSSKKERLSKRAADIDTLRITASGYQSAMVPVDNFTVSNLEVFLTPKSTTGYGRKDSNMVMPDPDNKPGATDKPLKVFILTGQSNMLGYGNIGDLLELAKTEEAYSHLVDEQGNWNERKDVYAIHVMSGSVRKKGYLLPNTLHNNFGVDFQFGHVMGFTQDEQVLLLKAAIGNRSLGWDILPPGSERYDYNNQTFAGYGDSIDVWPANETYEQQADRYVNWYAGKQYDDYASDAKMVLKNLSTHFPDYKGQGYEIAGFVWFQGAKDAGNTGHAVQYEKNLVRFIKELRKTFDAPKAKFVCATITAPGGASGNTRIIADAQLAVSGDAGNYPEFAGNVLTTDSDGYNPPGSANAHYGGDAKFIYRVGNAMGWAMAELLR